ncbi:ABC transporter ATP-binding protein [Pseudothermotoga sp.]|nr:ABC transporter ATP-binding protein [Pseudothermotoga sp.]MCX7812253.1 ABC transporter ATP-binding protein [Pseudothermotoga sp.]MDW8139323.1 ABC transporter ATP-binding protein [Pseudothermotoga sp.]
MRCILEVNGVFKNYGNLPVLGGIDLQIFESEAVAIVGPSGCGKTTLLRIIAGLEEPDSGNVRRFYKRLGFVFQEDRLIPWRTAYRNVAFVCDNEMKVHRILQKVGLSGFEHYKPGQLSGGMRQRLNLARALVVEPDLLLLDEPFRSLDTPTKMRLMEDLSLLLASIGISYVLVTHDIREALSLAKRVYVMCGRPARFVYRVDLERKIDFFDPSFLELEKTILTHMYG